MDGGFEQPPNNDVQYRHGLWVNTAQGWQFPFVDGEGNRYRMRAENTIVFLHERPFEELDHIFIVLEVDEDEDSLNGFYVWRPLIPFFDELVADMQDKGFVTTDQEVPDEHDVKIWERHFNREPTCIEVIGALATESLDAEWAYLNKEWDGLDES